MAIARDAITSLGYSASGGLTAAHTCTGSDRLLFVFCFGRNNGTDTVTGITYNGTAMTRVGAALTPSDNRYSYLYVLANPASGSNNVVISVSSGDVWACAASYTGASSTGQPDSSNTGTASSATSLTVSTTVVASSCWLAGGFRGNPFSAFTAGAGTSVWLNDGTYDMCFVDSNGTVGTGSQSLIVNGGATLNWSAEIASFKPVSVATSVKDLIGSGFIPFAR